MVAKHRFLEHTADVLFQAEADTLEKLFEQCALAVEETMAEIKKVNLCNETKIKVEANDVEKLLFEFLNELIFYKDAEQLLFSKFEIKIKQNKNYELYCLAKGDKINPKKHNLKVDIKAITLHMFEVKKIDNFWKAQVLVDI